MKRPYPDMSEKKPENPLTLNKRIVMTIIPLIVFMGLAFIFYRQLLSGIDPAEIPSVLLDQKAPPFPTEPLVGLMRDGKQVPAISGELIADRIVLVNVWASWCVPCRMEHPVLTGLARDNRDIVLVGINYKDKTANALRFLGSLGNPFTAVSVDPMGSASIDWGVYGIPETFLVNRRGVIIHKHIGPISEKDVIKSLNPIIKSALMKNG